MTVEGGSGPTRIAIRGKYCVVRRRDPDGLDVLSSIDGSYLRTLTVDGLVDFACPGEEAWAFADDTLVRFALASGLELGRSRLPWTPSGHAVACSALGVVVGRPGKMAWIRIQQRRIEITEVERSLEATWGIPLGQHRVLVGRRDAAWIMGGASERHRFPLPPDVEVTDARATLGGSVVCFATAGAAPALVVTRLNGTVAHQIPLAAPVRRLDVAAERSVAAAVLVTGQIVAADLRLGKLLLEWTPPERADDIAIASDGELCLWAHDRGSGPLLLANVGESAAGEAAAVDDAPAGDATGADADAADHTLAQFRSPVLSMPPPPDEPPLPWPEVAPGAGPPRDPAEVHASTCALLEDALCHATLLLERLFFLNRNLGVLPRTATADDPLGGIVITDSDVATIVAGFRKIALTPPAARPTLLQDPFEERVTASRAALRRQLLDDRFADSGLARIVRAYDLDEVMTDLLILALCPDWDLRMGKLIGFLNNDATQQRPRMGHLLMSARFGLPTPDVAVYARAQAALFDTRLLRRDGAHATPVVGQPVRGDDEVVELSMSSVHRSDDGDAPTWSQLRWNERAKRQLRIALRRESTRTTAPRLVILEGIRGSGRMAMTRAMARELGVAIELCDLSSSEQATATELIDTVSRAVLRARSCSWILVIRSDGALRKHEGVLPAIAALVRGAEVRCFVLVRPGELESVDTSLGFVRLEPPRMARDDRRTLWGEVMSAKALEINPADLDDIAARYDCPPGRVHEICAELEFRRKNLGSPRVEIADVRDTLRDLTVQRLRSLAKRYDSGISLDDLLFPVSVAERLDELIHRLRHRHKVLSGWAFADKAHESYGVSALFVGPPGTGKTAAAAAIANALHIDLYIVDFSSIMSKWVGETEQNLAKIFDEAEASSVALLFDEADALFGKRSAEQKTSSDRYANLTINYLLQRMESYSGLAILTTNLESAMDDAFQRRITCKVTFPETDEEMRVKLWTHMLPRHATYADDVDLQSIAAAHAMQGAHIRRALTRAAFRAAAGGREAPVLTQADLMWSATAEYEDMGRLTINRGRRRP